MLNRVDLTKYLKFDPVVEINAFFDDLCEGHNEFVVDCLNMIRKVYCKLIYSHDVYRSKPGEIYDIIRTTDKLCLVNSYHVSITIPSLILMEYYKDMTDINFLEIEQITNDIRRVIDNNSMSYNMEIEFINEIIKDLMTSQFGDVNVYHTDMVLRDFDTKRSLAALMSRGDFGYRINDINSEVSSISSICNEYISKLYEYLKCDNALEYSYVCNIYDNFWDDLLRNIKDVIMKDYVLALQSFFRYILYRELNPSDNNSEMTVLEIMSLMSKLSKESKCNPIVTIIRLTINLILKDNYKISDKLKEFTSFTTQIVQNGRNCSSVSIEEFSSLLDTIINYISSKPSIVEEYLSKESYHTNYMKQYISSQLPKQSVAESSSIGHNYMTGVGNQCVDVDLSTLTEGFKVLDNGNIQLTFQRESSLMDEYSQNHRLLKYNHKLENYEGMKYNLVYLLILIDTIESKIIFNSKTNTSEKDEAKKVVRLCKGDLGVYLPIIQKHDKSFDLNKFYKQVKTDNNTIEIDTIQTISGIKMIVKSIL